MEGTTILRRAVAFTISLTLVCATVAVASAAGNPVAAKGGHQAAITQATKAANSWLKLIDTGDYQASWQQAAPFFKNRIADATWQRQIALVRGLFGPVESRKLKSAHYATALPGAPDGQYVVIQYDTSFKKKKDAVETVTPMKDKDGKWRVSGYYIK